jgi:sugar phosphate isomerase/epimerase
MKRRKFVQSAALATVGAALLPSIPGYALALRDSSIGIQLYTLKDIIRKDVKGTLKQVADIGFRELETYGYADGKIFGMPYADFNSMVSDLGLKIISGHYGTGQASPGMKGSLVNDWERAVEDAGKAGQKYMCIAWLHPNERKTLDDYKKVCDLMNKANETCKKAGVTFAYHNHDFEFVSLEGKIPYEVMCEALDPSVALELDIYWSTFANFDTVELFKKYSGRIHLWHVKDMDREKRERQTDVGSGSIDYKAIFKAADVSGMKHFFLEQEYFSGPQLDAITNGYKHLRSFV